MTEKGDTKPPTKRVGRAATQPMTAAPKQPPSQVIKGRNTSKIIHKTPAPPVRAGPVEVVSSSDEQEVEHRARRATMAGGGSSMRGLSLRWKIMIAMAGVTVTAALIVFVVVYNKALSQLNAEIDAKGVRLVDTLASIDNDYWLFVIHQRPEQRKDRLNTLFRRVTQSDPQLPQWDPTTTAKLFERNAALREQFDRLLGPLGAEKYISGKQFLENLRLQLEKEIEDTERRDDLKQAKLQRLRSAFKMVSDKAFEDELRKQLNPMETLNPLGSLRDEASGDIVQMSIADITKSVEEPETWSVNQNKMGFSFDREQTRILGDVKIVDGTAKETRGSELVTTPSRAFTKDIEYKGSKIRFYVLLSLDHIKQVEGQLKLNIFLATFFSVIIGLVIAWWLSQRITQPVKVLIDDINQVSSGDLEHQTVAHSSDEIGSLAETFNRMTQALHAAHEQEMEAKAMEHELGIAAEIQANLVPKRMLKVPGYDISAYYRPSKEVGGDYYDFIEMDETHAGLIVADVSGKGIPGSLVMSMTRALIRMEAERFKNTSPAQTLVHVNRMLAQDIKKGMFVTAIYVILDKTTNMIAVASAGHNPMLLIKSNGKVLKINPKGIALGFDKGPVFERTISEEFIQLEKGDRIVMFTDGTVEAMNADSEEFSDEKFEELSAKLTARESNQFLNLIVKALDEHKGDAPQHDDQTIVTLRYV